MSFFARAAWPERQDDTMQSFGLIPVPLGDQAAERGPLPCFLDVHVTTAKIPRTPMGCVAFGLSLRCCRIHGWQLILNDHLILAQEFGRPDEWLVIDVAGVVIADSRKKEPPPP